MTASFVALPVGQGDAFLYQCLGKKVLVDGGRSTSKIVKLLKQYASVPDLDIVVCTHNDADHAQGILGVLKSDIRCKEVWLPALWSYHLSDLLLKPNFFVDNLLDDWSKTLEKDLGVESLDEYGDRLSFERSDLNNRDVEDNQFDETSSEEVIHALEKSSLSQNESYPAIAKASFLHWMRRWPELLADEPAAKLLLEALAAATRIHNIALAACNAGAIIRWFEFGSVSTSTPNSLIEPLNASEVTYIKWRRIGILEYLALSKANRESLVFFFRPKGEDPGVVFSADSDFSFTPKLHLPPGHYLVTAPHHGAETNKDAYAKLNSVLNNGGIIVRSDGKYQNRPGNSYLSLAHSRRYCTFCRGQTVKQSVELYTLSATWQAKPTTQSCICT